MVGLPLVSHMFTLDLLVGEIGCLQAASMDCRRGGVGADPARSATVFSRLVGVQTYHSPIKLSHSPPLGYVIFDFISSLENFTEEFTEAWIMTREYHILYIFSSISVDAHLSLPRVAFECIRFHPLFGPALPAPPNCSPAPPAFPMSPGFPISRPLTSFQSRCPH